MAGRRLQRHRCRRGDGEGVGLGITTTAAASSPGRSHFFKIILSHTLESGKLGIPKSFLRRYGKDLSDLVLLKVPGGSTWPVRLEKTNDDIVWLWKGWRRFMDHYLIDHGHLIVFKYEGNSVFHVIIFDKSASEIDYPLSIESEILSPEDVFLSQKEENIMVIEDPEPDSNNLAREFGVRRTLPSPELASEFKSDHPFFKVVMRPSYMQKSLSIPCEFFKKHVQKNKQIATLSYSDKLWQVNLRSYEHRGVARLSAGWSSFVRETGLHVRDVCVFELIDRDNIVFRVSIFSSDGQIHIEQAQCRDSSLESAFHTSPCLSPITAHEKACEFESEYPFCDVVTLPSHSKRKKVTLPWRFIRTYIQKDHQMVNLVYLGKSFEVKLQVYQHSHIAYFGVGWSAFAREACLREGNVCVFELVNRDNLVFRVSIFSSAEKEVICIE